MLNTSTKKRRKANWIGHILRRNCLLKHLIEGNLEGRIEMIGRRRRCHIETKIKASCNYGVFRHFSPEVRNHFPVNARHYMQSGGRKPDRFFVVFSA
jgi:hypothetical protein